MNKAVWRNGIASDYDLQIRYQEIAGSTPVSVIIEEPFVFTKRYLCNK